MATGKHINVAATGFPGTNHTWRFIQEAFAEPLEAVARLCGDKVILSGVVNTAGTVSNGYVSYQGRILPFVGGALQATVTLVEEIENATYDVDTDNDGVGDILPTYKTSYIRFGSDGTASFPFSDLKPLKTIKILSDWELPADVVHDATYIKFTQALLDKLNGIEEGAEKNVQANWTETSPNNNAFIKNKPFNDFLITSGTVTPLNLEGGWVFNDSTKNYRVLTPPVGYTINQLAGFIPSLAFIAFSGDVNGDDRFWCKWRIDYPGNRVIFWGNASEHNVAPMINYLAIWKK